MSSGSGSTNTTTTQKLGPEQKELLQLALPAFKDIVAEPPQQFPDSTVSPFTPLQEQGQQAAVDAAGAQVQPLTETAIGSSNLLQGVGPPSGIAGANELIGGATGSQPFQDFLLSGASLFPESNPALAASAEAAIRPLERSLTQSILPNIRGGAVDAGQFGGSRQGIAEGLAAQGFLTAAGDTSANIFSQGFGQALDASTRALGTTQGAAASGVSDLLEQGSRSLFAAPQLANLALSPAKILESVGFQQQQQDQALLTEEAQRFVTEQMIPFLVAQEVANIAFGIPGGTLNSEVQGGGGGGGFLSAFSPSSPIATALAPPGVNALLGLFG